jgi:hypothetical protein
MWYKYYFTCDPDECDALVEFTARDGYGFPLGVMEMKCPCGRMLNYIGYDDVEISEVVTVTKVTPREVVKIDSNPYTL